MVETRFTDEESVLAAQAQEALTEGSVSKAEFGKSWPLSVSEGVLSCEGSGGIGAVTFEANSTTYAVNGIAKSQSLGPDIDEIWLDDPDSPGVKKDISPIIDRGLTLCE